MAIKPGLARNAPIGPSYRVAAMSGSLTTAVGNLTGTLSSSVFSIQWADTQHSMHILGINCFYTMIATFTTNQDTPFGLFKVHGYTTAPTGGTAVTFTAVGSGATTYSIQSLDNYGTNPSGVQGQASYFGTAGDFRIATTASLTAGTGTIDTWPMHIWAGYPSIGNIGIGNQQMNWGAGGQPNTQALVLNYQDGISIQPLITMGAAGKLFLYVIVEWAEVLSAYAHG